MNCRQMTPLSWEPLGCTPEAKTKDSKWVICFWFLVGLLLIQSFIIFEELFGTKLWGKQHILWLQSFAGRAGLWAGPEKSNICIQGVDELGFRRISTKRRRQSRWEILSRSSNSQRLFRQYNKTPRREPSRRAHEESLWWGGKSEAGGRFPIACWKRTKSANYAKNDVQHTYLPTRKSELY